MFLIISIFCVAGEILDGTDTRKFHVFAVTRCHEVFVSTGKISKGHSHRDLTKTATKVCLLQQYQNLDILFMAFSPLKMSPGVDALTPQRTLQQEKNYVKHCLKLGK